MSQHLMSPGAYLHADLPKHKFALLKLRGKFVDSMCDVNPEFRKHVRFEKRCRSTIHKDPQSFIWHD